MTIENSEFFIYLLERGFVETTSARFPSSYIAVISGKYTPFHHLRTFEKSGVEFFFDLTICYLSVRGRKGRRPIMFFQVTPPCWGGVEYAEIPEEIISFMNRVPAAGRYVPMSVRREVWERDCGVCQECGDSSNIEYDHIYPVSKGGKSTVENIQLLCKPCNQRKTNRVYA